MVHNIGKFCDYFLMGLFGLRLCGFVALRDLVWMDGFGGRICLIWMGTWKIGFCRMRMIMIVEKFGRLF